MAIEKSWPAVPPQLFTVDGNTLGVVNVASTAGFRVKQTVTIQSGSVPPISVQVKRVNSSTQLIVGPLAESILPANKQQGNQLLSVRQDISAYTVLQGAFIYANEQPKANLKPDDIIQAVYRQEPGTTIGVELDDQFGNPINAGNPLPVVSSNGFSPSLFGDVKTTFDANSNPIKYSFYRAAVLQGYIVVTYDSNSNPVDYQGYDASGNPL